MKTINNLYLRVHFAPSTECVDIVLTQDQYARLQTALAKHQGHINLEITSHIEVDLDIKPTPKSKVTTDTVYTQYNVCDTCNQRDNCFAMGECHYTGTLLKNL